MRYHMHGGLSSPVLVGLMELRERAARLLRSKLNPYRWDIRPRSSAVYRVKCSVPQCNFNVRSPPPEAVRCYQSVLSNLE
jgi:hypothetical protein